ncbi:TPA: thioredoxin family protein [Candidatus Micrarchaeota archaeon]|nr:thioredoxin family protein [Candidatus Micrarchaeota archaeon]HIH31031.1 thioredoxin family protein [Candidatus Micrarchaeota archaeon]
MNIKILGGGCASCRKLEENAKKACAELGIGAKFEKVQDYAKMMEFGISSTPALMVDGKVISEGRTPSVAEIKEMLVE